MAKVRVLVLRAPGTNCDEETVHAFSSVGAEVETRHVNRMVAAPAALADFEILCIPGGFSYGDDLGAGRVFAARLRDRLGDALKEFRDRGRLILGVCNGFQVLLQTGLLVERSPAGEPRATLALNEQGRFEDRWIHLKLTPGPCAFIREEAIVALPIAHGEGNFIVESQSVLDDLSRAHRISCRYVDKLGESGGFPINPNGAMGDVAGVCDSTGRVFALMPHPERHLTPYQHPQWTRRAEQPPFGDGRLFFANAVDYFK